MKVPFCNFGMKKLFGAVTILLALCIFVGGCAGKKAADETKPQQKVLRVGIDPTNPPFEFQKDDKDEICGYDVDLIAAVAQRLGYKPKFVNMSFSATITAIEANKLDVAIGAFTITKERAQDVDFSVPYFRTGLVMYAAKDRDDINSTEDLAGKRVAVQIGTTAEDVARSIKGANVFTFNTIAGMNMEVRHGNVDAAINDRTAVDAFLANGGDKYCKIVGEQITTEEYGIMVKKKSPLLEQINKALEEMKNDGMQAEIHAKWFKNKKVKE